MELINMFQILLLYFSHLFKNINEMQSTNVENYIFKLFFTLKSVDFIKANKKIRSANAISIIINEYYIYNINAY